MLSRVRRQIKYFTHMFTKNNDFINAFYDFIASLAMYFSEHKTGALHMRQVA